MRKRLWRLTRITILELAHNRSIIYKANHKFQWTTIYDYDMQFIMSLPANSTAGWLDIVDTTLYTTILGSSAVHKDGMSWQRCKSEHHLVRNICSFHPKPSLEENKGSKKTGAGTSGDQSQQWRYVKWFANDILGQFTPAARLPALKKPTARAPSYARLVEGTMFWSIANSLPTPKSSIWKDNLYDYPDHTFVAELLHDIDNGVCIVFTGNRSLQILSSHFPQYLILKLLPMNSRGWSLLIVRSVLFSRLHLQILPGCWWEVPKKRLTPVKWRIITDLSWHAGRSVNDRKPKDSFICTYDTIDKAIAHLKSAGKSAFMIKLDLSDGFRHVLVITTAGNCWVLLGLEIYETLYTAYFIDTFLPFGLRSSPSLFLRYDDTLAHAMDKRRVSPTWHYLGVFWTCYPPSS